MQPLLAVISLSTIVKNAKLVEKRAGVPLVAVVKDDAYGHGGERVSLALEPFVFAFAVATVSEGEALRIAGVTKEIFVLSPCLSREEAIRCAGFGLVPSVTSRAAMRFLENARVQFALNTGMNRYGLRREGIRPACREALFRGLDVVGVYSHLYAPELSSAREEQRLLFSEGAERVREFFPSALRHLSATGGILAGERYRFDAVRSGIALYGYLPAGFEGALPVRPAMKVYAAVSGGGRALGGGAGYGPAEKKYGSLFTLRAGYGDGLFRRGPAGNVGNLCMDAAIFEGRAAFGERKRILKDLSAYARACGTSEYEILVNLTKKAERRYV